MFDIGDLVEATITFMALPVQNAKYVVVPQLKVLTFLDRLVSSNLE